MKNTKDLSIGILGVGSIGKTLARKLAQAGHHVKVANSRGPETIEADTLEFGARAVEAAEAVKDVDVVILSIPFRRILDVAPLVATLPAETVIIDTGNYYPFRDTTIEPIEAGQVESVWVAEQLGRPIAKAWNSIVADSFARNGTTKGTPNRIALPVAADRETDRQVAMALVEVTGFDGFDAGLLADSWRQQPGSPSYCTDLTTEELPSALASAEAARLPKRRDLAIAAIQERAGDSATNLDAEYLVRLTRALFM
ncbi:MAG: oxidoreductase [Chthoniobacteraceae bacterium]|nr:oxidoreductase [Chthoniobacteraceae bacterium]